VFGLDRVHGHPPHRCSELRGQRGTGAPGWGVVAGLVPAPSDRRGKRGRKGHRYMVIHWAAAVVSLLGLVAAARAADPAKTPVTVFAAASLTEAFKAIGSEFERTTPGATLQFNFAGSPTLVQQIRQGAPADVFASADQANMDALVQAGAIDGTPRVLARNRLEIVVPAGNPRHIAGLADLSRPGLTLGLCAPTVPAGRYAAEAFAKAGLTVPPASQEPDVKAVLSKAMLGEIDAGIVYVTDVAAAGTQVEGIVIPDQYNVVAQYPIAVVHGAPQARAAAAFVDFAVTPAAQAILRRFGFTP